MDKEILPGQKWLYNDDYDFNHPKERIGVIERVHPFGEPPIFITSEVGQQLIFPDQLIELIEDIT